ncbi:ABC transporter permease [Nocardioides terrisoli]|uniref:ABC transporter permease n=1 Tax=Nocardioides terrisoli TaxID=3388267 RepID=UPI00287B9E5D|nr:ABC transporter permease subunit [Nocardioides marmorisolisilvae]
MSDIFTLLNLVPRNRLGDWINSLVEWLTHHWSGFFGGIANGINQSVAWIQDLLQSLPIVAVVIVLAVIALLARGLLAAVLSAAGLLLIDSFDQWSNAMDTLALVVFASVVAVLVSIPLGIIAAKSRTVSVVTKPAMDFMQTLPSFVYLLPAMFFFSIGATTAIVATIVFAIPPGVRLAELGIRQVDPEMVEAGQAFGARSGTVLRGIQIPLAMPTIMAGVNQVIMLSLSMTVIAGLVGAGGLGGAVVEALQTLDIKLSVDSGVSVVILAIYLDRITAGLAGGHRSFLTRLREDVGRRLRPTHDTAQPDPASEETAHAAA